MLTIRPPKLNSSSFHGSLFFKDTSFKWGEYVGGSIQKDNRSGLFYIQVYWKGKHHKYFRDHISGELFGKKDDTIARKRLAVMQTKITEKTFDPEYYKPHSPMSVRYYSLQWLEIIEVSRKTYVDYRAAVQRYIIPFFEDKDIREIRHMDIMKFHKWIPRADKGKANVVGVLKTMLRYAHRNEDINRVPPFPRLSYKLPEIEALSLVQQEKILAEIPARHRPIYRFMMATGVRPGEARALMKDCIRAGQIVIKRAFSDFRLIEKTKGDQIAKGHISKLRYFEITKELQEIFDSAEQHLGEFVFIYTTGKPYSSDQLNRIWKLACEKTGIKIKLYNACRHSLGSQLSEMGEDLDTIAQILGHTDARVTRRYVVQSPKRVTEALERRRKVLEFPEKAREK